LNEERERERERESFYTECNEEEGDRDYRGRATTAIVLDQTEL
jgi:hypothetical protein